MSHKQAYQLGVPNSFGIGRTPSGSTVTAGSATILAANSNRVYVALTNDSDTTIYLALGNTAVANKGIRINANGGVYEITSINLYTGSVNAIHTGSGNKNLCILEATL